MIRVAFVGLAVVWLGACAAGEEAQHRTEVARTRAGDLQLVLLADDASLPLGAGSFTLEFRSASDDMQLVDVGTVQANATMPMPGSSPMFGSVTLEPSETAGRYRGASELTMAGEWRLRIEWMGPAGSGQATFVPSVQ